ncbi:probable inactive ATP-dependent zinc metalloprotease FTSHI 5, chloroplastic [Olea europaea subsp. europaea]|uniref:Probable inactive ATP-dependent zinc metalloprotease FTSHI 5, chloroplastic n=1 Tax=Olea europaea subsp. europaea TaxID=158383 RepID=A0A8S0S7X1_OLEEU|nr:probable inactive ATP-dependent zinc metalloprotease FTSHI 5, chloroplastic [Olea europaea subsp. europaea]
MRRWDSEYNEIWERIEEIEDSIVRKQTLALSIGARELLFIKRELERSAAPGSAADSGSSIARRCCVAATAASRTATRAAEFHSSVRAAQRC